MYRLHMMARKYMKSVAVMMSGTIPHSFRFQKEASIVHIDYQINNIYTKNIME